MQQANPIEVPDEALRELMNSNPMQIELRGYEVARWTGRSWDVAVKYQASERGRLNALATCTWLSERWPTETYRVRPIISLEAPVPVAKEEPITTLPAPAGDIL